MSEMSKILKQLARNIQQEATQNGYAVGYWLVRESDKARFFISEKISEIALEQTANKVLNDKHGYDYWIDYCFGLDVEGRAAWSNIDQTDRFI